jgi:hypothetical protein
MRTVCQWWRSRLSRASTTGGLASRVSADLLPLADIGSGWNRLRQIWQGLAFSMPSLLDDGYLASSKAPTAPSRRSLISGAIVAR